MKKNYVSPTTEVTPLFEEELIICGSKPEVDTTPSVVDPTDDGGQDESEDIDPIDVFGPGAN